MNPVSDMWALLVSGVLSWNSTFLLFLPELSSTCYSRRLVRCFHFCLKKIRENSYTTKKLQKLKEFGDILSKNENANEAILLTHINLKYLEHF